MGGKALKFPKRKKFVAETKAAGTENKEVTPEEHEERMKTLRAMGIIK